MNGGELSQIEAVGRKGIAKVEKRAAFTKAGAENRKKPIPVQEAGLTTDLVEPVGDLNPKKARPAGRPNTEGGGN